MEIGTETDFEDAGDIRLENNCMSCLDLFTCFIYVEYMQTFVTASNYFGSEYF